MLFYTALAYNKIKIKIQIFRVIVIKESAPNEFVKGEYPAKNAEQRKDSNKSSFRQAGSPFTPEQDVDLQKNAYQTITTNPINPQRHVNFTFFKRIKISFRTGTPTNHIKPGTKVNIVLKRWSIRGWYEEQQNVR